MEDYCGVNLIYDASLSDFSELIEEIMKICSFYCGFFCKDKKKKHQSFNFDYSKKKGFDRL